jgi:hypothetical protein
MNKNSKVKTKAVAKKATKATVEKVAAIVAPVSEVKAIDPAPAKVAKNTVRLANGTEILVRGAEKTRAGYVMGNVGWQDFLRPARLALNLATYASKIGAADTVVKSLMVEVDNTMKVLSDNRVKVPSDMSTQKAVLDSGMTEAPVGTPDFILATRKLSSLVKFVADVSAAKALGAEILSAQLALKASK